jgi:hypothetical protein
MDKIIALPNTGLYPILPKDIKPETQKTVTHKYEVDLYLTDLAVYSALVNKFYFDKNYFYTHLRVSQNFLASFSMQSFENMNKNLEESGYIVIVNNVMFLTHKLIVEISDMNANVSKKIKPEHIQFDEIPKKTELERLNPGRFLELKEVFEMTKEKGFEHSFDTSKYPQASKDGMWLDKEGKLTTRTIMYFFKWYPSLDIASVKIN